MRRKLITERQGRRPAISSATTITTDCMSVDGPCSRASCARIAEYRIDPTNGTLRRGLKAATATRSVRRSLFACSRSRPRYAEAQIGDEEARRERLDRRRRYKRETVRRDESMHKAGSMKSGERAHHADADVQRNLNGQRAEKRGERLMRRPPLRLLTRWARRRQDPRAAHTSEDAE